MSEKDDTQTIDRCLAGGGAALGNSPASERANNPMQGVAARMKDRPEVTVTDDLPQPWSVSTRELDVLEIYLGALLDELLEGRPTALGSHKPSVP